MIDIRATLKQAADAYKAGDTAAAQRLCLAILTQDPTHPDALFLSSFLTDIPVRQATLLQMALERDPNHARARARLAKLQAAGAAPALHCPPGGTSAPPASPASFGPQTPAFSAPISDAPPASAASAARARTPVAPPRAAQPARTAPFAGPGMTAAGPGVTLAGPGAAKAPQSRRGAGSTALTALLVIALVVVAAGAALALLNRRSAGPEAAGPGANIVLVTRTPLPTDIPTETPLPTDTPDAAAVAAASVATAPPSARTGLGSPSQPVPLDTPFTLKHAGAPALTLRIDAVIRGDEAARRMAQASLLNPPPPPDRQYLLLHVVARLEADVERAGLRPADFVGYSQGALYPIDAQFLYPPPPELNAAFGSPGAETSGWVAAWVPTEDSAPLVYFSNARWPDGVYFATT